MSGSAWDLLGIAPTTDVRSIKRAYAQRLKAERSDRDPERFAALRAAHDEAMAWANGAAPTEPTGEDGPSGPQPAVKMLPRPVPKQFMHGHPNPWSSWTPWQEGQGQAGDRGHALGALKQAIDRGVAGMELDQQLRSLLADPQLQRFDVREQVEGDLIAIVLWSSHKQVDVLLPLLDAEFGWASDQLTLLQRYPRHAATLIRLMDARRPQPVDATPVRDGPKLTDGTVRRTRSFTQEFAWLQRFGLVMRMPTFEFASAWPWFAVILLLPMFWLEGDQAKWLLFGIVPLWTVSTIRLTRAEAALGGMMGLALLVLLLGLARIAVAEDPDLPTLARWLLAMVTLLAVAEESLQARQPVLLERRHLAWALALFVSGLGVLVDGDGMPLLVLLAVLACQALASLPDAPWSSPVGPDDRAWPPDRRMMFLLTTWGVLTGALKVSGTACAGSLAMCAGLAWLVNRWVWTVLAMALVALKGLSRLRARLR